MSRIIVRLGGLEVPTCRIDSVRNKIISYITK